MDGRTKGSLKFADEIFDNAKKNLELQNNNEDEKVHANAIKALVNPKHQLSDEEIRQEIITILVAVSVVTIVKLKLLNIKFNAGARLDNDNYLNNTFNARNAQKCSAKSFK